MSLVDIRTLISFESAARLFNIGLEVAQVIGLPVTTWRGGDPSRAFIKFTTSVLADLEGPASEYIRAGFLSLVQNREWAKILALDVYGVTVPEATYATPTVTVNNTGNRTFQYDPGDFTFRASESDKTYHNTNAVEISPNQQGVIFELIADEAGSDSSVGTDEIDEKVTSATDLEIASSTSAYATDEPSLEEIKQLCIDSRGALSPNGPADAYAYIAKTEAFTGETGVTRARAYGSTTGAVTVYIAGPDGPIVDAGVVAAVQDAVELWATPLTANPTVASASALSVSLSMTIRKSAALSLTVTEIVDELTPAVQALFASVRIGGDGSGFISESQLTTLVHNAFDPGMILSVENVEINSGDATLDADEIPVLADGGLIVTLG